MINFLADSVQVRNSKVGDEVTVTFTTGIYEWDKLKDVVKLNDDEIYVYVSNKPMEVKDEQKSRQNLTE